MHTLTGDYPEIMRETQKNLPKFTAEQKAMVMGSIDFFSLNLYTAHFVRAPPAGAPKAQVRIYICSLELFVCAQVQASCKHEVMSTWILLL